MSLALKLSMLLSFSSVAKAWIVCFVCRIDTKVMDLVSLDEQSGITEWKLSDVKQNRTGLSTVPSISATVVLQIV